MSVMVCLSTPAAPRFARTACQPASKTSRRYTLSYRAWNRRVGFSLAARPSLVRSSWTFQGVRLACAVTHPYPPPKRETDQGPFPPTGFVVQPFIGTMAPSDSLSAPSDFGCPYTLGLSRSTPGRRRVSPVPRPTFPACRRLYSGEFLGAVPGSLHLPRPSPDITGLGSPLSLAGSVSKRQRSLDATACWIAPHLT
jgi:hypothetical protein